MSTPTRPKGGTMSFRGTGASSTFDSLNAFILHGDPAQGLAGSTTRCWSSSATSPDASYGLLAESLEYPPDRILGDLHPARRGEVFRRRAGHRRRCGLHLRDPEGQGAARTTRSCPQNVAAVEALDPHRVNFTFAAGVPTRDLPAQVGGIEILPKHYYAQPRLHQARRWTRPSARGPMSSTASMPAARSAIAATPTTGRATCR